MKLILNNIMHVCVFIAYGFLLSSCTSDEVLKINIDKHQVFQTIEGFGASDAWRCQFVGKNWPNEKKERIAELLFSKDLDSQGNPKGIGLSIWRFYIGAGTAEQGMDSDIKNEWRRAESFIDDKGFYDWNKQEGQQWFLKKAKSYGVERFLAFSISAPVQWTKNGKGYNSDLTTGELNLLEDKYDDYAKFMVEVIKHFDSENISFEYLSPINEPQWEWEKKTQEGTPATNDNIAKLAYLLNTEFEKSDLNTEIVLAEAADLRWLYSSYNKPKRGNQIDYFFGENNAIQNLKHVKNTISGHSYFTTWPVDSLVQIRKKLNKTLETHDLDYWQSEFCILENTDDIGSGNKRDLGIDTALYVARVIHADLTLANSTSWQWWTALTNADYKDGLIYLDSGETSDLFNLEKIKYDGDFHDSKLLWAFGNYSRFIKPDMVRIDAKIEGREMPIEEEYKDIMLSAYLDEATSELAIVAINYGYKNKTINISNSRLERMYVTSASKNLELEKINNKEITLMARSVNTLIGSSS
ncbi:endo-1,4-beta-xylanase [Hyunsoonleella flava]|uniref:Endo-1,4-beta-xylanase n=1 Tax=Hyunsoonleella flava TaxID=2527939 RepID=A0A4Q9FJL7_9FLAO|nr:glycoside hydrolase [Hyunsoonleella flava]TBN06865.1 endo-1,4-beta-xylanase [Hyunsoonleella flava]